MTPDTRREVLAALARLSDMAPDVRIGQLVAHLGVLSEDDGGRCLGEIEDGELLKIIDRHRGELAQTADGSNHAPLEQAGLPSRRSAA